MLYKGFRAPSKEEVQAQYEEWRKKAKEDANATTKRFFVHRTYSYVEIDGTCVLRAHYWDPKERPYYTQVLEGYRARHTLGQENE